VFLLGIDKRQPDEGRRLSFEQIKDGLNCLALRELRLGEGFKHEIHVTPTFLKKFFNTAGMIGHDGFQRLMSR
jgi:hypothetical protein